ncbi:hypothetical protein R3P38DRAFT_3184469 [Favolaschia claudopus]|uniref:Uncharacterized protein n=1 Tax=Favolaschia claudopus TaxID=2862362 RepID=A0AAW0C8L8_9AGAR
MTPPLVPISSVSLQDGALSALDGWWARQANVYTLSPAADVPLTLRSMGLARRPSTPDHPSIPWSSTLPLITILRLAPACALTSRLPVQCLCAARKNGQIQIAVSGKASRMSPWGFWPEVARSANEDGDAVLPTSSTRGPSPVLRCRPQWLARLLRTHIVSYGVMRMHVSGEVRGGAEENWRGAAAGCGDESNGGARARKVVVEDREMRGGKDALWGWSYRSLIDSVARHAGARLTSWALLPQPGLR